MQVKPVLQALLLAERIYTLDTGQKAIIATFDGIQVGEVQEVRTETLPSGRQQALVEGGVHPGSPYVYISITDVVDETELVLQFVNLTKNRALFTKPIQLSCQDRLQTIEIVLPLPDLRMFVRDEGHYAFEVLFEGEIIGSHRIAVTKHNQ